MRAICSLTLAFLLGISVRLWAAADAPDAEGKAHKSAGASVASRAAKTGGIPLTEEEIGAFKDSWEQDGRNLHLYVTFEPLLMTREEKKKASPQKASKLRYKLTARLFEMKEVNNRIAQVDVNETAHVYILDSEGKVVEKKSPISLTRLSAASGGSSGPSGLIGEVEKPGSYKAIVWVNSSKAGRLGKVLTTRIEPPRAD